MNLRYACKVSSPARSTETPLVFVVDADPSSRETLEGVIRSVGLRCQTVASAEEFLATPRAMTPSCLLVDLNLPGAGGLELQRLVFDRAELPIIFMSRGADVQATVRAMKAGAFDFLIKPFGGDVLLCAIRQAIERSRAEIRHLATMRALQDRYESLSRREREVMELVVSGRLNKQVGGELGISEITVKAHRGKLMRKMHAGSFAELVTMAAGLGRTAWGERTRDRLIARIRLLRPIRSWRDEFVWARVMSAQRKNAGIAEQLVGEDHDRFVHREKNRMIYYQGNGLSSLERRRGWAAESPPDSQTAARTWCCPVETRRG